MNTPVQHRVLGELRDAVGESPVWSVAEQSLYWVDIPGKRIHRHALSEGATRSWITHEQVGCIALQRGGALVAAMETGVFAVELAADGGEASSTLLAPVTHAGAGMRFNDGRCDRAGRLWAGTMCMDMANATPDGVLYSLEPAAAGEPEPMTVPAVTGLLTPNGLGFSPDDRTMYLSDSNARAQLIWRFDFDRDSGTPSNRREFVDMNQYPGRPDGAAVDEDGCYWICANDAGLIHRFTPGGVLDRSVALPVSKPAMCAFGGARLDTLFVTSIKPARAAPTHPDEMALAGAVFALDVGARGLPEPLFGRP